MFSSAGYFRSANCPFFIHGLCHRPYCHFRHAKPGHGSATKSTVKSCLKTKVPATKTDSGDKTSTPSKAKDTVEASPKSSLSLPNHEPGSATTSDIQSQNKAAPAEPQATKPKEPAKKQVQKTPQSKSLSILESLNKLEAAVEEASASLHTHYSSKKLSDVINIKKRSTVKEKSLANENDKSIGKDKKEKTFTDEDKISSNKKEKLSTNKTENSITSDKEKTFLDKKKEKNSLPDKNTDKNEEKSIVKDKISETTDIKTKDDKSNASRVGCNQNIKDISTKISNESELPSKQELQIATEKSSLHKENSSEKHDLNTETSKPYNKDVDNNVTEFEFNITEDLMEQVHDKTHHKTVDNAKRKLDLDEESIHVAAKRRKSSTGSDELSKKVDKSKKKNHENSSTTLDSEKDRLKRKKLHEKDSMKKQITENSTKKSKESSEKEKSSISLKFKKLDKVADPNSDKKSKTKRELQDIDFFLSPKKSKTKSQEKEKPDQSSSSTGKHKTIASDDVKLKTLRKHMTPRTPKSNESKSTKNRNETSTLNKGNAQSSKTKSSHTVETINSLFESDEEIGFSSDSFSDSEPETAESGTDTLKEIFDNYDPKKEGVKRQLSESVASTSGVTAAEVSPAKDRTGSTSEMQGLGKKRRVAHNPTYLIQRKASNINPVRRLPKATTSIPATPPKPTPDTNAIHTKKRLAHVPKPTTQTSLARPRIPLEYGAKVPQNLRQRYLDKIIDENLRLYATEKEAFDKGVEEERSIYERATRRPMYLNLCCNAVKVLRSKPTPEFQHDPTPYGIASTSTPIITGSASKESPSLKKIDVANLTGEMTYELLSQYMLNEEQLVDNGYPRHCPSTPGKVTFKPRRPLPTPSKDPNRRTCCRCGRRYTVREDGSYVMPEECVYHVGRLFRRRIAGEITSSYQCCGGDASTPGCAVCKYHVCEGKNTTDGFMTTIISPLAGNQKKVFGVDCEMCYTTAGLELTRVTVVDWKLDKVYDTFVKPDNPILDYNTRFSGVTQECLRGVKTSIREVQAVLLSMISKDSILVGHSLESDLLSLKLVHSTVVDTSVVFPHRLGPPYKRALRTLMAEFVKKIIQNNEEGHDSYEDAKASLELMLFKVKEDLKKKPKPKR